ncbi:hypothetical protein ACT3UQ_04910 [Glutamicibacter sp. AOP12-B1-11]|uniref:hypothetical protein n=1 Tax=Glutamicibacter sp. AOP12-B1-11 TaxID=3457725 RepID=UPI0040339B27
MANAKRTPIQAREFATELQPLTDRHALAVQMARDSVRSLEMKAASGIAAANNLIAMNQAKVPDSPRPLVATTDSPSASLDKIVTEIRD